MAELTSSVEVWGWTGQARNTLGWYSVWGSGVRLRLEGTRMLCHGKNLILLKLNLFSHSPTPNNQLFKPSHCPIATIVSIILCLRSGICMGYNCMGYIQDAGIVAYGPCVRSSLAMADTYIV